MDKRNLPERILDRKSVERVIQRAAELQADDRDVGEGLSESEMLALGEEVGIPRHIMRRAMVEEQSTPPDQVGGGVTPWLVGLVAVHARRVIRRESNTVERELSEWMSGTELLTLKRRFPERTSWEPRKDPLSSVKRAFGSGKTGYTLSKVREVTVEVTRLEEDTCHVSLVADISNFRTQRFGSLVGLSTMGGLVTTVGLVLGFAVPVAILPALGGIGTGVLAARARHRDAEKVSVAMEQILDKIEHDELRRTDPKAVDVNQLVDGLKQLPDIISRRRRR